MIRTAIVGLGWWGQTLVNAVHGKSEVIRFVACHVRNKAKAEAFCRDKGLTYIASLDELLTDPTIDAVVLATPHQEHGPQIERAAAAGKHIYVEKPFTLDVASADKALAAVRKAGVALAVGFQRRFAPNFVELRARVKDGRLGIIAHSECEANAHAGLVMAADSWRTNPEQAPAGAMTALGIHSLDGMIDLFGEIEDLICLNVRRASTLVDDTTSIMMRFKSGMTGTLICCLATAPGYRVTAFGSKGYVEISGAGLETLRITSLPSGPPGTPPPAPEVIERKADALKLALEAFGTAAAGGAPYPTTHAQIRHGVAAFEAIVRSARSGKFEKVD